MLVEISIAITVSVQLNHFLNACNIVVDFKIYHHIIFWKVLENINYLYLCY